MKAIVSRLKGPIVAVLAAASMVIAGLASAQMGGPQGGGELQEIQQRLGQIQQQAFENNPELQEQAQELETAFLDKMKEGGYEPERDMERLQELQQRFSEEDVSESEREDMMAEAQEIQMNLQEGQQMAMQDDEIIDAQNRLQNDMLDAMRAEDPETDDLIARFEQLQQEQMQQQQPMQ